MSAPLSTKKVLNVGELLLRMSPRTKGGWIHENKMPTYVGGAELNVATALSKWDIPSKYFTALPDHALSHDLIAYLNEKNIDTSSIHLSGNRIGIYFLPQGSDLKNAGVIYDRAYSSFYELQPGVIDWENVLRDVSWVHFTAISPALNVNVTKVCLELVKIASQKNITVSLDLNYRAKLWKYGKEPKEVMPELAQYCDLIMGNIWAAEKLLGIPLHNDLVEKDDKQAYLEHAQRTSEAIIKAWPKVKSVANTFRFDANEKDVRYYATLYTNSKLYVANQIEAEGIKDKIGSGDCFMAGLIYGFQHGFDPERIVNYAAAAAVGKMYETSDATEQTAQSILSNLAKNISLPQ